MTPEQKKRLDETYDPDRKMGACNLALEYLGYRIRKTTLVDDPKQEVYLLVLEDPEFPRVVPIAEVAFLRHGDIYKYQPTFDSTKVKVADPIMGTNTPLY